MQTRPTLDDPDHLLKRIIAAKDRVGLLSHFPPSYFCRYYKLIICFSGHADHAHAGGCAVA
jgi:hypothetical protein